MARVGRCRLCGSSRNLTRHHVIPVSAKTRIVRSSDGWLRNHVGFDPQDIHDARNIVPLCRHHHDAIELGVLTRQLRWALDEHETMHIERVAGPEWLDAHYPKD